MRRQRVWIAIALLLCLLAARPAAADKSYSAGRFDALLDLQPGGVLIVTETVQFRFRGGPFTYVFRDLAYTGLDEMDLLQAGMDGRTLSRGSGPGQVEVVAGRPLKVTWHFNPTSDSVHEFVLTYRVQGAIRQEAGADALIWRAIPEDHDYAIARSTVTLRYPMPGALLATPQLSGAAVSAERGDGQVRWSAGDISSDESLVVTARFAPGTLVQAAPQWQSRQAAAQAQGRSALVVGLTAAAVTLMVGAFALAAFALRHGANAAPASPAPVRRTAPPEATPPGLAVHLAGGDNPALATLFDLAGRGLLRIEESGRGWFGGKRYRVVRTGQCQGLLPHETGLLRILFEERDGQMRDSVALSDVGSRLPRHIKWYKEPLEAEIQAAGWIDLARGRTRRWLMGLGLFVMLDGLGAALVALALGGAVAQSAGALPTLSAVGLGVAAASFLLGVVAMVAGRALSPLNAEGERLATFWKGLQGHLNDVLRGREAGNGLWLFERYLPLTAGFGMGEAWARHFQKQGYDTIPSWFRTLDAGDGDFGAVIAAMSSTNSSFSSADGGAAAAAGASGGGGSGAG